MPAPVGMNGRGDVVGQDEDRLVLWTQGRVTELSAEIIESRQTSFYFATDGSLRLRAEYGHPSEMATELAARPLPLEALDERRLRATLAFALTALGQETPEGTLPEMLREAQARFSPARIPQEPRRAPAASPRPE